MKPRLRISYTPHGNEIYDRCSIGNAVYVTLISLDCFLQFNPKLNLSDPEFNEKDIDDSNRIEIFIKAVESEGREMVLISKVKTVGAILTTAQHNWFIDQPDTNQDAKPVKERQTTKKEFRKCLSTFRRL